MSLVPSNFWTPDNEGLTDTNGNPAKRLYVIGNWSKFVRPGWVRMGATANPQGGAYLSAFRESATGNFAIVVINQNGSPVAQSFALNGLTTTSVTPWVTSATLNLTQQSSISVSNGAFSYTLPAASVTTLVGTTGGSSALGPPTNVRAIVQ
jgi:glucuronoarabinoxylan endo-1,4-beta-xylanase